VGDQAVNITFGIGYYPMWKRGGLCFHENGGRKDRECLDATLIIWKFTIGITIWGLGFLSKIARYIPVAENGRGFVVGRLPEGKGE
jgi:hypothetical protein